MCGRETLFRNFNTDVTFEEYFELFEETQFADRYNIAPGEFAPIIRLDKAGNRECVEARWGLIPAWAKEEKLKFPTFNARSEEVRDKPTYRDAIVSTRCVVPSSGFYEWKKEGLNRGKKTPYFIAPKTTPYFAYAGLYSIWTSGEKQIQSFTVLTTEANDRVAELHNRMPVILDRTQIKTWLDPSANIDVIQSLLKPSNSNAMDMWQVSQAVNKSGQESKAFIEPLNKDEIENLKQIDSENRKTGQAAGEVEPSKDLHSKAKPGPSRRTAQRKDSDQPSLF